MFRENFEPRRNVLPNGQVKGAHRQYELHGQRWHGDVYINGQCGGDDGADVVKVFYKNKYLTIEEQCAILGLTEDGTMTPYEERSPAIDYEHPIRVYPGEKIIDTPCGNIYIFQPEKV